MKALPFHYGWVVAVVGCMGMVASVPGQTIGVNVFNEKLIEALGVTRSHVSAAYLFGTALSAFFLPYAGTLFDRFGARLMIAAASVGLSLSLVFMSQVDRIAAAGERLAAAGQPVEWLRMAALIAGFFLLRFWGQGVVMMTSRNMIGKWWEAHRGKIFSIGGIGVAICFSLAPQAFDALIEAFGWRQAWLLMAALLTPGFALLGWAFYRDNPEEQGLSRDAGLPPPVGQRDNPEFQVARSFARAEALRCYAFWVFGAVFGLQACYFTAYTFHVVDVAADIGMSKEALLRLFLPAAGTSAGASLLVGWACDRWRLKYLLAFMSLGILLAALGLLARHGFWTPALLALGFGIGNGSFGALSGAFLPRFFGVAHLGAISGFFMSLIVVSSAVGPFLFSLSRSWLGSYDLAHWVAAALAAMLALAAFTANNPQRRLREELAV